MHRIRLISGHRTKRELAVSALTDSRQITILKRDLTRLYIHDGGYVLSQGLTSLGLILVKRKWVKGQGHFSCILWVNESFSYCAIVNSPDGFIIRNKTHLINHFSKFQSKFHIYNDSNVWSSIMLVNAAQMSFLMPSSNWSIHFAFATLVCSFCLALYWYTYKI